MRDMGRLIRYAFIVLLAGFAVFLACQAAVYSAAFGRISDASDAPPMPVAIVLGASVLPSGKPSDILADRLTVAADLYERGVVERVLVSGDNGGRDGYDEVNAMRRYLLDVGVAPEHLFLDHAGFDTYDSLYRASRVFGVTDALIVTQRYHLPRALFVARSVDIRAVGVASDLQPYVKQTWFSFRESLARVKAVLDVITGAEPEFLGERVDMGGDGRETWDQEGEN